MELFYVKGGCFQMGDTFGDGENDEKPVHEVCIDDFYMGKYEVTQRQWTGIMGSNPSKFENCDDCPVEKVSWDDAQEFINKLNAKSPPPPFSKGGNNLSPPLKKGDKGGFRLPTEAEWEYAARSGGRSEKYSGGNNIDSVGWYDKNSGIKTHPVGQKEANGLGLYDMSGNVWEWVQDWYDENYYKNSPKNNPKGPDSGQRRVLRGASSFNDPRYLRASNRYRNVPAGRTFINGFRLSVSVSAQ
ncbi:MAG: formylglycine-generating enzyme family protein [Nitrospinae bacterium]|nr:formylglycine-generating enzyme family protein [Nitrospinota bacterium]